MTFEEYKDGLKGWKLLKQKVDLVFSEFVEWGSLKFGREKVHHELSQLQFDLADVKKAIAISTVPAEMRHPNLTAEHYVALARSALPAKQKAKWAKTASQQSLTPSQLKASIEAGEVVTTPVARQQQHGIITVHGIAQEIKVWLNRVGGIEGIKKMSPEDQSVIRDVLREAAEVYNALNQ